VTVLDPGASPGYLGCGDIGVDCQLYRFDVPAGGGTYDFSMTWSNTSDLGLYFLGADGATFTGDFCDALFNGDPGPSQPEVCSDLALAAGTYYLAVVPFGPLYVPEESNPDWVRIDITGK
jgi:hypothetical protein